MKSFNIHFNPFAAGPIHKSLAATRRGFSAVVTQHYNLDLVDVSFAYCSKRDEFNKRKGLSTALLHKPVTVTKKYLPTFIHDLERGCFKDEEPLHPKGHYNYLYKNFF